MQQVFDWILFEINNAGYLLPEAVFIDGTHIKASANIKKLFAKPCPRLQRYTVSSFWKK